MLTESDSSFIPIADFFNFNAIQAERFNLLFFKINRVLNRKPFTNFQLR